MVAGWSYPKPEDRGVVPEELPHDPVKEQRLLFAGAAMRRYPTFKVRENQVRR